MAASKDPNADVTAMQPETSGFLATLIQRKGVGFRLLALILLFSSVVTLVLTGLQLALDFRRDVSTIETRLDEIEPVYLDSIALALWNVDQAQLKLVLKGIHRLPDIESVSVREINKQVSRPLLITVGTPKADGQHLSRIIPVRYVSNDQERIIGELFVEASLTEAYARLFDKTMVILASQGLKTFLISFFILMVVWKLVTRHLRTIADYTDHFDIKNDTSPLKLARREPGSSDELTQVVSAVNQMIASLRTAYRDLRSANKELERDISLRREYEDRLRRQAHFDTLTSLPNRVLMMERLDSAIEKADTARQMVALFCFDLDRFQNINDTRGHVIGDKLLRQAADRLQKQLGNIHTLARIGGDEFAIVLEDPANTISIEAKAEQVLEAFVAPFHVEGIDHFVSISMGVTIFPNDGTDGHTLLRNADLAMNQAKEDGRNGFRFFTPEIDRRINSWLDTERRLRGAIARNELELHYQPIFSLTSPIPVGAEALVRWRQPDGALASPATFIPVAEDSGLISDIGDWVLSTACRTLADLKPANCDTFRIAVNVSPVQLRNPSFSSFVEQQLLDNGLTPDCLELEITERVLMDDCTESRVNLTRLCHAGIRLSIDDFGTGYSSLAYLQRYPFTTLKIDRGFVGDAMHNEGAGKLVETIIAMAHGLDLDVIAEGVETPSQIEFLTERKCDEVQGFLLGRPVPQVDFPHYASELAH